MIIHVHVYVMHLVAVIPSIYNQAELRYTEYTFRSHSFVKHSHVYAYTLNVFFSNNLYNKIINAW